MDPLSILSTAISGVGYIRNFIGYVNDVRGARESMGQLFIHVNYVYDDLEWLQSHFEDAAAGEEASQGFLKLYNKIPGKDGAVGYQEGPLLKALKDILQELKQKLGPLEAEYSKSSKKSKPESKAVAAIEFVPNNSSGAGVEVSEHKRSFRASFRHVLGKTEKVKSSKTVRQLRWPFSQEEEKQNVETMLRLRNEISAVRSRVNVDATLDLHRHMVRDERTTEFATITKWLTPSSFDVLPQDQEEFISMPSIPSRWLLKEPVFRAWESGRPWRLFIFGEPGSGKSVVASHIVSYLRDTHTADKDTLILNLYLKSEEWRIQTQQALLASLLKQIVSHYGPGNVPEAVKVAWSSKSQPPNPQKLPVKDLLGLLKGEIRKFKRVYIIVDGLDEANDEVRHYILADMRSLSEMQSPTKAGEKQQEPRDRHNVSLLYTSRRLEVQASKYSYRCNNCSADKMTIYYTCKVEAAHGKNFHLCQTCALSHKGCGEAPHQLEEPYSRIELELNPPKEVIEEYVRSLIAQNIKMGAPVGDSIANDASASESEDDAYGEESYSLGRILRRKSNAKLVEEIVEKVANSSDSDQRLFMLARMQWEHIRVADSIGKVRHALNTMPKELNDSFKKTLERMTRRPVPPEQAEKAKRVVLWVSQAERVLTWDELQYAISVTDRNENRLASAHDSEDSEDEPEGFDQTWVTDKKQLIANTRGLLEVTPDDCVRLCHKTASDYLKKSDVKQKWFPDAETYMASICLVTLLTSGFKQPLSGTDEEEQIVERIKSNRFASYACQYWGFHAQRSQAVPEISRKLKEFLVDSGSKVASTVQLAAYLEEQFRSGWDVRKDVNPLHVACWFGLDTMFEELISKGFGVNSQDATRSGRTPLIWACRGGNYQAVRKLLELGADPNKRDRIECFPLFSASYAGKTEAVRALCEAPTLDVNATWRANRTALMGASSMGFTPVIAELVKRRDVDVNMKDASGWTALSLASSQNSVKAVKALLEAKDIDIESGTNENCTPLHLAAMKGLERIVHVLLHDEPKANPLAKDMKGGTPLRRAIDNGHKAVVEEFKLEHVLDKDTSTDVDGKNLLFSAAVNGHDLIVQILLGEDGFDVNSRATDGSTPLHDAAAAGKLEVVKILRSYKADVSLKNARGETAADVALAKGEFDICGLLQPAQSYDERILPATALARRGSSKLLEERMMQPDTDILKPDTSGEVPLSIAIRNRKFDAARIILKAYAMENKSLDVASIYNRTPLHEAALSTESELVQLMLDHKPRPALNRVDSTGLTPLYCALRMSDNEAAIALIEAGAEIDPLHLPSEEVLTDAIEKGRKVAAERLIYANVPIKFSHRHLAKEKGNVEIIRLLDRNKTMVQRDTGVGINISLGSGTMADVTEEPNGTNDDENELVIDHGSDSGQRLVSSKPAFAARPKPMAA